MLLSTTMSGLSTQSLLLYVSKIGARIFAHDANVPIGLSGIKLVVNNGIEPFSVQCE